MRSLLNNSLYRFIGCTVVVLLLLTPAFYILTKDFYAEDLINVIDSIKNSGNIPVLDLKTDITIGLMIQFGLIFLVLSISLIITLGFVTKELWRPFNDTLQKIERFNLESSTIPFFYPTKIKEFTKLNQAVLKLMEKDIKSYKLQRHFIENASHELQTPIAVFQSKLDLLLQENLNEKQSEIISDLYSLCDRLNKLHKDFLFLAKIDNRQYGQFEPINIAEFLKKKIIVYKDLYSDYDVQLMKQGNSNVVVSANYSLLESLFSNLIVNAIRYSPLNHKVVRVVLNNKTLTISNAAIDNKKLDEEKMFQRFNNQNKKGNGLGLAIAKAICDYHRWTISYMYNNNQHHFSVIF